MCADQVLEDRQHRDRQGADHRLKDRQGRDGQYADNRGGVGPATGPNKNGGPADKFFLRKFPAAPNLALAPNDPKFAGAVHTAGNRLSCAHGADGGSDHVD